MGILSESFSLGDKYLISIKFDPSAAEQYFRPELFEGPEERDPMILLAVNIINIISDFQEYMLNEDMWDVLASDLFIKKTQLSHVYLGPKDGEVDIVSTNSSNGSEIDVLIITLKEDTCPTIFE